MANPVTVTDLEFRWRPLTPAESTTAWALLEDAWAVLTVRAPALESRLVAETVSMGAVVQVVTAMVLRVLRNPDGKRQVSIDDYSYTIDQARSTGGLYVSDSELELLGSRVGGAFSIMPSYDG